MLTLRPGLLAVSKIETAAFDPTVPSGTYKAEVLVTSSPSGEGVLPLAVGDIILVADMDAFSMNTYSFNFTLEGRPARLVSDTQVQAKL